MKTKTDLVKTKSVIKSKGFEHGKFKSVFRRMKKLVEEYKTKGPTQEEDK